MWETDGVILLSAQPTAKRYKSTVRRYQPTAKRYKTAAERYKPTAKPYKPTARRYIPSSFFDSLYRS